MNRIKSVITSQPVLFGLAVVIAASSAAITYAVQNSVGKNPPASLKMANNSEVSNHNSDAPVVKTVLPSVVNISSSKIVHASAGMSEGMNPLFRQFFGKNEGDDEGSSSPEQEYHREKSLGSGVIVSPEGYILTNNHVVDEATDVRATLSDRREFRARIVGTDPKTDIAVLKIETGNLSPITIGDSSKAEVGDTALAIGNPFGVGQTVTKGIVSATGRGNLGIEAYEDFIQTDAPINPGNSGGALINDRGELIGINTAMIARGSGGSQGIGFAIPANLACQVMDQILKNGKVTRGYLGIYPQDVTPGIAKAFGEKDPSGVLVGDVSQNSPAQAAGLRRGDIILDLNGKALNDSNQLRVSVSMMQPGTKAQMRVIRDGQQHEVSVQLGELPTEKTESSTHEGHDETMEGMEVEALTPETAKQLHLPPTTTGLIVKHVSPSSSLAESGLREGDVIQEVNHAPVKNATDLRNAIGHNPLLLVNRRGQTLFIAA